MLKPTAIDPLKAEVILLGTGGGYGESCLIHIGDNNWVIVDSCKDPISGEILPLKVLNELNVLLENVILVICTHWHDDHIQGLSKVLKACNNAEFSFAKTHDRSKFLNFVGLDYQKLKKETSLCSTFEFTESLKIMKERKLLVKGAYLDRPLKSIYINKNIPVSIHSLSPSDYAIEQFDSEISTLINDFGETNRKIKIAPPNNKSVTLLLKLGSHRVILGADLEVTINNDDGWLGIIKHSQIIDKKSSLFKIPHHGSKTGYHDQIWQILLDEKPIGKLTPWNKKSKLPSSEMLDLYKDKTSKLYITSSLYKAKPKEREKTISKMITKLGVKITEIPFTFGVIRCKVNLLDPVSNWDIETHFTANEV